MSLSPSESVRESVREILCPCGRACWSTQSVEHQPHVAVALAIAGGDPERCGNCQPETFDPAVFERELEREEGS